MEFRDQLNTEMQLLLRARTHFDIWAELEYVEKRGNHTRLLDDFPEFARRDSHAHFVTWMMYFAQILETKKGTLNLKELMAHAPGAGLSDSCVRAAEDALGDLSDTRHAIAMLRSNLFAHRSRKLSYQEVFSRAGLVPNQLKDASDRILGALNVLLDAAGEQTWSFKTFARDDLIRLSNEISS